LDEIVKNLMRSLAPFACNPNNDSGDKGVEAADEFSPGLFISALKAGERKVHGRKLRIIQTGLVSW
jgi:hypothetical protein